MGVFFGTDGIRGKFNDDISFSVAYNLGNSVGSEISGAKILIGRDTRNSGSLLTHAFACGAMNAGADVVDVGVCPTAGIAYLTNLCKFNFGVVVSASHNPAEFNGLKVLDQFGKKLDEAHESRLEKKFLKQVSLPQDKVGKFTSCPALLNKYIDFLKGQFFIDLHGKHIVIDCANGAASVVAKRVFKCTGAKLTMLSTRPDGTNINQNCGALHTENLSQAVKSLNADMGFAFDGDSDRLIAVDENGKIITGDLLLYIFAKFFKSIGRLEGKAVVGTRHTNMGVELALKREGIELIRADIGDKYVSAKLIERHLNLGGEQSGHIIIRDYLCTGDGVLNALLVCKIVAETNRKLSELSCVPLYLQENINVEVKDKLKIINSEKLTKTSEKCEELLKNCGRIMIRVSGTEPYIRIMVESQNERLCQKIAEEIAECIRQIDREDV